jgi:di/tricarboxylate transporter
MTPEAYLVVAILAGAVVLFVFDVLRSDLVALIVLAALLGTGIISPSEGFSGFANPATVTVAAMFVLSAGLERTGSVAQVGSLLARVGRHSQRLALLTLMLGVAVVSAFINNTAAVAVLLPTVLMLARETRTSPSKLLIPLSFASLFGGTCTLIGTSTNILVSSLAREHGAEPIGMFELAPFGLILLVAGIIYMMTLGPRLLPDRGVSTDLADEFDLSDYVAEVRLIPGGPSVGRALGEAPLALEHDLDVLAVVRDGETTTLPGPGFVLHEGDFLRVRCELEVLKKLEARRWVEVGPQKQWRDETIGGGDATLVEVVVASSSILEGKTLDQIDFRNRYGGTVLAIRHHDRLVHSHLAETPLKGGDAMLVETPTERLPALKGSREFIVVSERGPLTPPTRKAIRALAIVAGVVALAASGLAPISVAALGGAVALVLLRCLTLEEAYRSLDARTIVLLGGILPLGIALESTGVVDVFAYGLVEVVGPFGPTAVLCALYLLTSALTSVMSNNATAVLLVPIAFGTAAALGVDARPLLMAVAYGASASFMTPVGYQTNTLVYGPGAYRFVDYLRVGTPLNVMFWLLATLLIPVFWPF